MSAAPPAPRRKPLKLRLDTVYGPAPSLEGKYRSAAHFKQMHRGYQWTQGFDVEVTHDEPRRVVLACATHRLCPFSITALYTIFTHLDLAGQSGFHVAREGFHAAHDHCAPFVPLDVDAENVRLAHLEHGDPAIDSPPLVRAAATEGAAGPPVASSASAGSAARPSPSDARAGANFARHASAHKRPKLETQATPAPRPPPAPSSAPSSMLHELALPSSKASNAAVAPTGRTAQPPTDRSSAPHATPQDQPAPRTSTAARPNPFLPPARPSPRLASPSASPSAASPDPSHTPLGSYLALISPHLAQHLPLLALGGLPASTPGAALVELDSGADGDRAVLELVRETAGGGMRFFDAVLIADGTRKAKRRVLGEETGGGREVDPKLVDEDERSRLLKYVQGRIEVGRAAVAAREAA